MTVRQLEALIRISESFARMSLAAEADDGHVAAAFDLFTKSTINAMNAGLINSTERLEVRGFSSLKQWSTTAAATSEADVRETAIVCMGVGSHSGCAMFFPEPVWYLLLRKCRSPLIHPVLPVPNSTCGNGRTSG